MQTVICKKCRSRIILTSDDEKELKKWEDKGGICFRCKQRNGYNKRHKQEEVKESVSVDEEILLKEKFKKLLELRKQYFDFFYGEKRDGGVVTEIEDFFDVDLFEVFNYYKYDYFEFFKMGEDKKNDNLTWSKLLNLILKYKESKEAFEIGG